MSLKFANNAYATLAGSILSSDTTINLTAGQGARFPALSAGDYFFATLSDTSNNLEIIKVTARSTDAITVLRGQDGTTARAYSTGDRLELRWCNASALASMQESHQALTLSGTDTYTGSLSPVPTGYNSGQIYWVNFPNTNTATDPTVNLNSLGAKTIKLADGSAIAVGEIPTGVAVPLHYDGTVMRMITDFPTLYGKTIKSSTLTNPANTSQTLTDGATISWNADSGAVAQVTLGGNRTLAAPTNLKAGGEYTLHVIQDATGGRTLAWNAVFKGIEGSAMPAPNTTANTRTTFKFTSDGTNLYLVSPTSTMGAPTGTVLPYAGASAPSGWLLCDGSAVSRTTYAALFALVATTYGVGDGSTTFNLPDLRGRAVAGKDDMGGSAANRITNAGSGIVGTTLGANGGAETVTLSTAQLPAHNHGVNDSGHTHTIPTYSGGGKGTDPTHASAAATGSTSSGSATTASATTGITTQNNGSGNAHQNTQPTIILNYMIKT
jgi:microcystin-dependent protein